MFTMRSSLASLIYLCFVGITSAANSFAGSNLYYAAGLSPYQRTTLLSSMQSAGMKVLRVWLDGQSTASTKLELSLSGGDIYGQWWGTGYFYEKSEAIAAFDNRLRYILNHTHKTLGNPWKQLNQYIFAFEAQNKAMVGKGEDYINTHMNWQCDHANTIKSTLGSNSGILVMTGGESWMTESVKSAWLGCAALDVVAIHAYGVGDFSTSNILTYVNQAKSAGKKLIFQEWGACYFNTENNNCPAGTPLPTSTRNNNIKTWASQITAAGVPWLYWQVLPNPDPHVSRLKRFDTVISILIPMCRAR
ncbi:Cellulase domain-containing protein [Rhizoctonia solani AG-1 IA]|uniref:Cellulase domain-containing protein n=1 Tax=Thanatephorus cucumeris (strain AG1-IA) TaxID=983506 RepID=L8WQH4_THACA|nr:Cellulase domain-containing protein [Rhizoctonia solani AG-1 IA]